MGWSGLPQLVFADGKILFSHKLDRLLYPEYFEKGGDWPVDPITGEKMRIHVYGY